MGKWLDRVMEWKESEEKISDDILKTHTDKTDTIAVPDYFDELEREYYFNLVEFMESQKHGMDRETAEREAGAIVTEYRLRKKARTNEK